MARTPHRTGSASVVVILGLVLGVLVPSAVCRAHDPDITRPTGAMGAWATQDRNGVIWIERCGGALCGRIVGIRRAPGEPIPLDASGSPQCGLTILTDERPADDGSWLGRIIDPRDGKSYRAELWMDAAGNLLVRGFVGLPMFGRTQTWHRYAGTLDQACDMT